MAGCSGPNCPGGGGGNSATMQKMLQQLQAAASQRSGGGRATTNSSAQTNGPRQTPAPGGPKGPEWPRKRTCSACGNVKKGTSATQSLGGFNQEPNA